jgi:integrase
MRLGEVIGLRRNAVTLKGDVTIRSQVVEVRGHNVEGPPKSANGHRVLPLADLATQLQQHIGRYSETTPDGFVFTARDGSAPLFAGTWRKRSFDPAVKRSGIPRVTPHDLRHSAACQLADHDFSTLQVARWLGDTSATIERVYANVLVNSHERMAQVFNRQEVAR